MSDEPFTITQHPDWEFAQTGRVPSLMRKGRTNNNALQLSLNWNASGTSLQPRPKPLDVAHVLARNMGAHVETSSEGVCEAGDFGRVVYSTPRLAYGEAWIITDGIHVFVATYSCDALPSLQELEKVTGMVRSVRWPQA